MGLHRTPVLGHIDCPVCGLDMDVKKDKNGHAMGYCPDDGQQLFTRNDFRSAKLLARMRPLAAATPAPAAQPAVQDVKEGADRETSAPAKKIEPAAATPAAGATPKVRAPWFAGLSPIVRKGQEQHGNGK